MGGKQRKKDKSWRHRNQITKEKEKGNVRYLLIYMAEIGLPEFQAN